MNIVHAARQYPPGVGGVEAVVSSMAERQARAGNTVRVITLDRIFDGDGKRLPVREARNGVELIRIPYLGHKKYPIAPDVLRHLRDADVVHVHGLDFFADFLGSLKWLHRKPLVLSTHGGFFHTSFAQTIKKLWFNVITRTTLRGYSFVVGSSVQDADTFRPLAGKRVVAIENAVDVDKFAGLAAKDGKTIIYFGRIAPNKGVPRLIDWFAQLHARDPEWRLIVAGKEMGVALGDLHDQARALGVGDAFETHSCPSDDALRRLIGRARVYACASTYEGFGLAAVEAIGAGLYPLLSDIPPFVRTLDRVGMGTAIAFEDPASVDRFLSDLATHDASGDHSAALAARLAVFDWQRVIEQTEALYQRAIAAQGRPPQGSAMREAAGQGQGAA